MRGKLEVLKTLAASDSSVWLFGEAGTGKELAAEFIHKNSKRKDKLFIKINCAGKALAASGNNDDTAPFNSVFAAWRDGCTLFIDEISLLPQAGQQELLNLLKLKAEHNFDFRILVSTKCDVENMAKNGRFNEELYYKISVCPVFIPPLRDRQEDIIPLAGYFLTEAMLEVKNIFSGFSGDALEALKNHQWPGNVRELKNTVLSAVMTATPPVIDKSFLFPHNDLIKLEGLAVDERNLKMAVDAFKASFLEKVLRETGWNQTTAAARLGIERTYLSKLIKDMDLKKKKIIDKTNIGVNTAGEKNYG